MPKKCRRAKKAKTDKNVRPFPVTSHGDKLRVGDLIRLRRENVFGIISSVIEHGWFQACWSDGHHSPFFFYHETYEIVSLQDQE